LSTWYGLSDLPIGERRPEDGWTLRCFGAACSGLEEAHSSEFLKGSLWLENGWPLKKLEACGSGLGIAMLISICYVAVLNLAQPRASHLIYRSSSVFGQLL